MAWGNPKQCDLQQTASQALAGETVSCGEGGKIIEKTSIIIALKEGRDELEDHSLKENLEDHSLKENSKTESDQEAEAEDLC